MSDQPETAALAPRPDAVVTLRPVTPANVYDVLRLRTTKDQEQFVATNAASLAEAAYNRHAWPRAIYADETPVGFVMLYDAPHQPEYFLWRLMLDHRYQRLGFGRRALEQVIDYVCGRTNATTLGVSYHPGAGSPQPFYAKLGFVETGEVEDGENIMRLDLQGRTLPAAPRPLTHVVLFKLQDPQPAVIAECIRRLVGLEGKVPELRTIEVGADILHSGRSYDLALIARFDSLAEMQRYQSHPEHLAVLEYLRTVLAGTVVVDYEFP